MGAAMLSAPELALDKDEAKMLAEGIAGVQEFYAFSPSAESVIWANLIMAMTAVYGPRVLVIYNRKKTEPKKETPIKQTQSNFENNVADIILNPGKYR
jgi:hypothetical protein